MSGQYIPVSRHAACRLAKARALLLSQIAVISVLMWQGNQADPAKRVDLEACHWLIIARGKSLIA
jgi:hypothetical protein